MQAIRVHATGGPDVLTLDELPDPVPGPGELLIDVEAAGVNFIEIYQREGLYTRPLPFTLGAEAAGTVRAVGPDPSRRSGQLPSRRPGQAPSQPEFRVGDRVVSQKVQGAYAERALVAAERAVRVPDGVSTKQAAAVFLQGLTAQYLTTSTCPLAPGDWCLVHAAAGGVGLLLVQIAKRRGARVIGTASSDEKLALARAAGLDVGVDYTTQDFVAEVKRVTNGAGVRVVYDSVGRTTFDGSLDCLMRRGLLVLFGQSSGPVPPVDPQVLNRKGSLFLTRPTLDHYVATRAELVARASELLGWVADGSLHVHIGAAFPLASAAEAHRALASRGTTGKVILLTMGTGT